MKKVEAMEAEVYIRKNGRNAHTVQYGQCHIKTGYRTGLHFMYSGAQESAEKYKSDKKDKGHHGGAENKLQSCRAGGYKIGGQACSGKTNGHPVVGASNK